MGDSIGEILKIGGFVMWPLIIFSVITWAIVFERTFVFLFIRPKLNRLSEALLQSLKAGDYNLSRQLCHTYKPYIAELFLNALSADKPREISERVTERNRLKLLAYLKRNLWILGTIGSSSPFIGLLGTVIGIVRAFNDMAVKGSGGFAVVAAGISEALVATAAGLIVAIIALLTYNIFINAANQVMGSLKLTLEEIIDETYKNVQRI